MIYYINENKNSSDIIDFYNDLLEMTITDYQYSNTIYSQINLNESVSDIKDKLISAVKAAWEFIQGIFRKIKQFITDHIFKGKSSNIDNLIKKNKDKKYDTSITYFDLDTSSLSLDKIEKAFNFEDINIDADDINSLTSEDVEETRKEYEEALDTLSKEFEKSEPPKISEHVSSVNDIINIRKKNDSSYASIKEKMKKIESAQQKMCNQLASKIKSSPDIDQEHANYVIRALDIQKSYTNKLVTKIVSFATKLYDKNNNEIEKVLKS